MSFQIRTTCPNNNPYYIRQANGGYNGAILGNPTKAGANVLANCVGYANGRFAEIMNKGYIPYQLVCNAENFIEAAQGYGLQISDRPTLGGIMVWQKGSLSSGDGVGHVEIVENIIDENTIYTSGSSYRGSAFFNVTRSNSNGRWGMNDNYSFRGCIVNPMVAPEPSKYGPGSYEVTASALNVRRGPGTNYGIVTTLENGSKQGVDYTDGDWGHLLNDAGWICLNYCELILPKYYPGSYEVNTDEGLNVREEPSTNSRIVTALPKGSRQGIDRTDGDWGHILNNAGWINLNYCKQI